MAPPVYTPGQVIGAADVNSWFVPMVAVKTADQLVTSSTTVVNDTELFLVLPASATFFFHMFLDFEGGTLGASDIKWTFTVPGGCFFRYSYANRGPGGGATAGTCAQGTDINTSGSAGAGNIQGVLALGTIVNGVNPGNVQLRWAQNTSSATSTIMHAQSCMMIQRIT